LGDAGLLGFKVAPNSTYDVKITTKPGATVKFKILGIASC
jgi:hypothetical protein